METTDSETDRLDYIESQVRTVEYFVLATLACGLYLLLVDIGVPQKEAGDIFLIVFGIALFGVFVEILPIKKLMAVLDIEDADG
jgi:hypothetical protein